MLLDGDLGLANVDVFLGLTPRFTLAHVLAGNCTLEEVVLDAPQGFKVVPAASGIAQLAELDTLTHLGLVRAFGDLTRELDVLVVDTAPGIAGTVLQFSQAAQQVLVVVCDEPASLTDAYALIKVLSRDHGVQAVPRAREPGRAAAAWGRPCSSASSAWPTRFLDVELDYVGEIPEDPFLRRSIREQRPVVQAYPQCPAVRGAQDARAAGRYVACGRRSPRQCGVFRRAPDPASVGAPRGGSMTGVSAYSQRASARETEALVMRHAELVKRIAYHLAGRLPASVEVDDLIQAGMLGLLEAAANYSAGRGASFETYAGIRIRGAMLDGLRKLDWAPRSVHRKARAVANAIRELEAEIGREARDTGRRDQDGRVARRIPQDRRGRGGLPDREPHDRRGRDQRHRSGRGSVPRRDRREIPRGADRAIASLPERERMVMSLYYDDELNLKEIGAVLKVSESRVCQIHGQALTRLQARLSGWRDRLDSAAPWISFQSVGIHARDRWPILVGAVLKGAGLQALLSRRGVHDRVRRHVRRDLHPDAVAGVQARVRIACAWVFQPPALRRRGADPEDRRVEQHRAQAGPARPRAA